MINSVRGTLSYKGLDSIRVDNNGIEWECSVPARSVDAFGLVGEETRVLTWLLHREDQMRLYGFATEEERALFLDLMTVDGIGPKQALKILGGIGAGELERALDNEDLSRLQAVPGLGKKTAEKLVFALKGRIPARRSVDAQAKGPYADIVRVLVDMGYDRRRASEAVAAIDASMPQAAHGGQKPDDRERDILRRAIVELSAP